MTRKERIKRQLDYHKRVEQAWAKAKEIGEELDFIRQKVITDVYFLLYYVLERKDMLYEEWWENETRDIDGEAVPLGEGDELVKDEFGKVIEDPVKGRLWRWYRPFLFERCREFQKEPDGYLDIWARDHYKSTIITYAGTIQEILKNPEITICIMSYNVSTAQKMMNQIKNVLGGNSTLIACFPDVLFTNTNILSWKDEYGTSHKMEWADTGFNVKRLGNPKEHTVECSGLVTGQNIGGHYDLLIYDDVVTPESVATVNQSKKTLNQFEMSLNLGSTSRVRIRMIGTFYAKKDPYYYILENKTVKLRKYPCIDENGESRLYSNTVLKWKLAKMHGMVVNAQMYCDPQENSSFNFQEEWIGERVKWENIDLNTWNWYIICDPAMKVSDDADYTVFIAVGVRGAGSDKHYLVAGMIYDKIDLVDKQKCLFKMVNRFTNKRSKPTVFYERVSMQSDIQHYQDIMVREGNMFTIIEASGKPKINYGMASTGSNIKYKDLRISALVPLFKSGKIHFVESDTPSNYKNGGNYKGENINMVQQFISDEYLNYPFGDHDDGLDCLSRIADLDVGAQLAGYDERQNLLSAKKQVKKGIDYYSKDIYHPII